MTTYILHFLAGPGVSMTFEVSVDLKHYNPADALASVVARLERTLGLSFIYQEEKAD